ncbi:MAG: hypothetical protein ACSHWW_08030 [Nonlabens sp.]|uniref:hypothetical protein n=1 Tax=Nonlabens sp. TaxID=1888209 RepID=UPI003EF4B473
MRKIEFTHKCSENWDGMKPHAQGKFCSQCDKSVVDFTDKTAQEISNLMSKHKNNLCARMTSEQLKMIYPEPQSPTFKLPYSKIASTVMIAASIGISSTAQQQEPSLNPSLNQTQASTDSMSNAVSVKKESVINNENQNVEFVKLRGLITFPDSDDPLPNVKITFYGLANFVSTYSLEDGTFLLNVPKNLVSDKNLVSYTFDDAQLPEEYVKGYFHYESIDVVLNEREVQVYHKLKARHAEEYLGVSSSFIVDKNPAIVVNGEKVPYRFYKRFLAGKSVDINFSQMTRKYVEFNVAEKFYGNRAAGGLILFYNQIAE